MQGVDLSVATMVPLLRDDPHGAIVLLRSSCSSESSSSTCSTSTSSSTTCSSVDIESSISAPLSPQVLSECILVVDKAARPAFSVTEASWSEVPPLCRHAPTHARNLKRISVSRWEGCGASTPTRKRRPWIKAPKLLLNRNTSAPPAVANECVTAKKAQTLTRCLPMPTRKASMDMVHYSLPKPMRKASMEMITAEMASLCKDAMRMPLRKASMDMMTCVHHCSGTGSGPDPHTTRPRRRTRKNMSNSSAGSATSATFRIEI